MFSIYLEIFGGALRLDQKIINSPCRPWCRLWCLRLQSWPVTDKKKSIFFYNKFYLTKGKHTKR